jgi:hypothetical protein
MEADRRFSQAFGELPDCPSGAAIVEEPKGGNHNRVERGVELASVEELHDLLAYV